MKTTPHDHAIILPTTSYTTTRRNHKGTHHQSTEKVRPITQYPETNRCGETPLKSPADPFLMW
jgi:hypothetical protein